MIRSLLVAGIVLSFSPYLGSALHAQESGAAQGRFHVPPEKMAGQCVTMVSPTWPHAAEELKTESTVVVQAVISKAGRVSPVRVVSGQPALQAAAMNAVRLWRYRPFTQNGAPIDVTTDIQVDFVPGKPGGMVSHPNN